MNDRSDEKIEAGVREELFWDGRVDPEEIAVSVRDGLVTLRGTVGSFPQKRAATSAAKRVKGVLDVTNDLQVRLLDKHRRTDAELRGQVLQMLGWDVLVPKSVDARVADGVVTLCGTVHERYEREEAEATIRNVNGVREVRNEIVLARGPAPGDVEAAIARALARSASVEARKLEVEAVDGTVTLRGTVESWSEHDEVLEAVWSAPGVLAVDDRLAVRYVE